MNLTHKYLIEFDAQKGGFTAEGETPTCFADLMEVVTENAWLYSSVRILRLDFEGGVLVGHDDSTDATIKSIAMALSGLHADCAPAVYDWIMEQAGEGRAYVGSDDECDLRREMGEV